MLSKLTLLGTAAIILSVLYLVTSGSILKNIFQKEPSRETERKKELIKVATGATAVAAVIPIVAARAGGYFDKYNIEVEEVTVENSEQALLSNSVDVAVSGGFTRSLSAAIKGGNLVWIAAPTNNSPSVTISRLPKEKIRVIGSSSPNAASHRQLIVSLQILNINTDNLKNVFIEDQQARFAAIEKGDVDAISVSLAEWLAFQKTKGAEGISVIFDYRDFKEPLFPVAIITNKETIEKRREPLVRFLASILEGTTFIVQNPERAEDELVRKFQIKEEEARERVIITRESLKNLVFVPSVTSVEKMLTFLKEDLEEAKDYDPNLFIDKTLAEEAMEISDFPKVQKILNQ